MFLEFITILWQYLFSYSTRGCIIHLHLIHEYFDTNGQNIFYSRIQSTFSIHLLSPALRIVVINYLKNNHRDITLSYLAAYYLTK